MNILVVDDDTSGRKLLRAKLEAEKHRVVEADDGVQALGVLARESVDGVISDVLMPNMDGYRFCLEVRKNPRFSALPFIIYTTTFTSPGDERLALEVGADAYLTKPTSIRTLLEVLTRAVSERRLNPSHIIQEHEELLLVREYSDLLVRKLEEKHRDLQQQTEELRRSEERLSAFFSATTVGMAILDADLRFLQINDALADANGLPVSEHLGKTVREVVPDLAPTLEPVFQKLLATGEPVLNFEFKGETRAKLGVSRHWVASYFLIKTNAGTPGGLGTVVVEITDHKRAEEELRNSRERLRALAAHLQLVREEERTRISREVHDELGQMLTGLKMDLRWVENRMVRPLAAGDQKAIEQKIIEAEKLADATIDAIHRIAAELRPSVLDHFGLSAALGFEATQFEKRAGIQVKITAPEIVPAVNRDVATAIFRIFQEALTNVARHSEATAVDVRLSDQGRDLVLEVKDNGKGIPADAASNAASLGLLGMSERLRRLGGHLYLHGVRDTGTTVTVWIPRVKPNEASQE
jgi:two-component system, NarL family, sensor histidine kinase UhpB